jgi:hypothetical protein
MRPRAGPGDGPPAGTLPIYRADSGKEVPMSVHKARRFRSLLVAWLLAAGLAVAQVATALADGSGGPFPR